MHFDFGFKVYSFSSAFNSILLGFNKIINKWYKNLFNCSNVFLSQEMIKRFIKPFMSS